MDHALRQQLKARADVLAGLPTSRPPAPWRHVAALQFVGLTEIGFADSSDLLLALSDDGRSLIDGRTGQLIARDDDHAFDAGNLTADGIGPIAGAKVRMAGLRGGGLSTNTADGWGLQRCPLAWPDDELILSPPGQTMLWTPKGQPMKLTKLAGFEDLRAFGFSPTGRVFIIATAANLAILSR